MATPCPPEHPHGDTGNCYNAHGCRCDGCILRHSEYGFYWRHMTKAGRPLNSRVDATGTRRRIQALMALGWNQTQIAAAVGSDQRLISRQLTKTQVARATHDRIAAAFETMSATLPPAQTRDERSSVARAKAHARRNGWVPPLAWDDIDNDEAPAIDNPVPIDRLDDIAIELAIAGNPVELTPAERRACIRTLYARQWSDPAIAAQLHCADRTIGRIRDELGLPAWADDEQLVNRAALAA